MRRAGLGLAMVLAVGTSVYGAEPEGVLPVGASGAALNLDFEAGSLKDWTATGDAFAGQPAKGDVVAKRRSDMRSGQQGEHWVGSYESPLQDKAKGTLTSAPFRVTHPWAAFLVGGGGSDKTRVEVVNVADNNVLFRAGGRDEEEMARVVLDLRPHQGKEVAVRIVDDSTAGWGHVNFDDFRFYAEQPKFARTAATRPAPPPLDVVKFAGLKPDEAAKAIKLPDGFRATLFAGEPDVVQPVAMAIDGRGRVWVAEALTYPKRAPEGQGKDRIVIFEDADGDGRFDKRTVFTEGLNLVSGLEVGFGGVWVGAAPYLLFIPSKDLEKPDGEPRVVLDGFGYQDTHETLNAFTWGPDGWLYGCHGVFTHSKVGKPGTPDDERTKINAGVWRFHPTKNIFEVFAEGTSNPWGVDFNDMGQAFVTACVIPHLYHMVQGGRYQRQAGQPFNAHTYREIQTIADHRHWAGGGGPHAGNNRSDAAGGGHAHAGAMFYLGGGWPAQYRDALFMSNIHGNRINSDILEAKGSGYVGHHGPDLALMNDKWSRLINMRYGPDGDVYAIDWYDQQACHLNVPEKFDRGNGRIYKIAWEGNQATRRPGNAAVKDLAKLSDADLVGLQGDANEFFVRHARRVLQERQTRGAADGLRQMAEGATEPARRLRGLWALHAIGAADEGVLVGRMKDKDAYVRGWAVQLACEDQRPTEKVVAAMVRMAQSDPSPVVRLYLASALPRVPTAARWDILRGLLAHGEDAEDHNLPCLYWYGLEPLVGVDKVRALKTAAEGKVPLMRELVARRMAAASAPAK